MKYLSPLLIVAMLLAGCSGLGGQSASSEPDWYTTPPANTATTLYGVGVGRSKGKATQAALNDLVARLGVNVSSQYRQTTRLHNQRYSQRTDSQIQSHVDNIRISNHQTQAVARIGKGNIATLVTSDRAQFSAELEQQIDDILSRSHQALAQVKHSNALERYLTGQQVVKELEQVNFNLNVLNSLHSSRLNNRYSAQMGQLQNTSNAYKSAIFFVINSNDNKVKDILANSLTAKQFVVKSFGMFNNNKISLKAQASTRYSNQYGIAVVDYQLGLETLDSKNNIIASNQLKFIGKGGDRYAALANALEQFNRHIIEQGLEQTLGLKLN